MKTVSNRVGITVNLVYCSVGFDVLLPLWPLRKDLKTKQKTKKRCALDVEVRGVVGMSYNSRRMVNSVQFIHTTIDRDVSGFVRLFLILTKTTIL